MPKKLKVLMLSHSSAFDGGAEKSMIDVFDYWVKKGYIEPYFVIRKPELGLADELKRRGWKYSSFAYNGWAQRNSPVWNSSDKYRNILFGARTVAGVEKLIDSFKPDVVMTNTIVAPWAAYAAYSKNVPHIWFVREYGYLDHEHFFQIGRVETFEEISTLSNFVITNSGTLADYVAQYIPKNKISYLYTPFDLSTLDKKINQKVESPFVHKNSLKLVITGRVASSKGQFEAAEAVGKLTEKGANIELCIIGDPADKHDAAPLKDIISKYKIHDRVHLVGYKENPLAYVALSDIGVMASRNEAFGRVTFEYMYTGKAVVGSNSGATPELIRAGKDGQLYKSGNATDLAKKLQTYIDNKELALIHGKNARRHAVDMMNGHNNADEIIKTVYKVAAEKQSNIPRLHSLDWWLQFPLITDDYINESRSLAVEKIIYMKLRQRAKIYYHRARSLTPKKLRKRIFKR